jgi:hypothetical protein
MGLAIEVGFLADMQQHDEEGAQWVLDELKKLDSFLPACGLQPHVEPESVPCFSTEMFGYSGLHHLRRFAAHVNLRGEIPCPGDENSSNNPVLNEYFALLDSPPPSFFGRLLGNKLTIREFDHLILHSDAEGFYLPQDFPEVLSPPETLEVVGGAIGSSHRLKIETESLAAALELPLDLNPDDERVWEASDSQGEGDTKWERYGVESFTCLRLHHAAVHSVKYAAAIVFT